MAFEVLMCNFFFCIGLALNTEFYERKQLSLLFTGLHIFHSFKCGRVFVPADSRLVNI